MWAYHQSTGQLYRNELPVGLGYSGQPPSKNDPLAQSVPNYGPIPVGNYTLGKGFDHAMLGPLAIPLTAEAENVMFGREGFFIHGDSLTHPGLASHGCIIAPHYIRAEMDMDEDKRLVVCS